MNETARLVSTDSIHDYFAQIRDVPVLTARDEVQLSRDIEIGVLAHERLAAEFIPLHRRELRLLVARGESAFSTMVRSNLRLVISIARKYLNRGVQFADLIQDGNVGLIRAVQGYDYLRGYRFSTYATFWIKEFIDQGVTRQAHVIKVPHHQLGRIGTVRKLFRELTIAGGREPTLDDLSAYAEIEKSKLELLLKLDQAVASLQQPIGDTDLELGDVLSDFGTFDPLDRAINLEERVALDRALNTLEVRERQVVTWAYGLGGGMPLRVSDIARRLALSRPATSSILKTSMEKLGAHHELVNATCA